MQSIKKSLQFLVFLSVLAASCSAYSGEYFLMGEVGRGKVSFDDEYYFEDFEDDDTFSSVNILGGYKFNSKLVLATHIGASGSEGFFGADDNYQLYEVGALLGYSFDLYKHFRIVPMIGVSTWELDRKEGELFNSGPEESREVKGTNAYIKLNFEVPLGDFVQLNLSYMRGQFKFGGVHALRFGTKFSF